MICGFTGTQQGMAPRQRKVIRHLLWRVTTLHLGDCIGADAEVHEDATRLGIKRISHPPDQPIKRACLDYDEVWQPKPYLQRNVDIAREGVDGLIAAPKGWVEELRSGTWTTIRAARRLKRKITIVRPDGSVRIENPKES